MGDARHLGGDGGDRLAAEVLVVGILGDVAAEGVLALPDRHLGGEPEGSSQASVAELRQPRLAAEHAGLVRRKIEPAELQELAMVIEAAQIAGFSQYGQGDDGPDARTFAALAATLHGRLAIFQTIAIVGNITT